jgi:hypothetical protein
LFLAVTALPAPASDSPPCANDPDGAGLATRIEHMRGQVDRIRSLTDRAEQRRLAELHVKHMHEGLRELRRREPRLDPRCHAEVMQSLLEQVIVHEALMLELNPNP